jgi:DNA-binding response OmpR family regulator
MNDQAKKILIVDDEPSVLAYLRAFLNDHGFETVQAKDGREGFQMACDEKPDLICLDITMPEESGVRMFRKLQENPDTAAIPVFIVTGISHDFKEFIETRKQVKPPEAYFDKPVDKEEFLAKIKKALSLQ